MTLVPNKSVIFNETLIYFMLKIMKSLDNHSKNFLELYNSYGYKVFDSLKVLYAFGLIDYEMKGDEVYVYKGNKMFIADV